MCAIGHFMEPDYSQPTHAWYNLTAAGGAAAGDAATGRASAASASNYSRSCTECHPETTNCFAVGTTLMTMPIRRGYWRVNAYSRVVLSCPQAAAHAVCLGTNSSTGAEHPLAGNASSSIVCRRGHDASKPFCAPCVRGYRMGTDGLCEVRSDSLLTPSHTFSHLLSHLLSSLTPSLTPSQVCSGSLAFTIALPSVIVALFVGLLVFLAQAGSKYQAELTSFLPQPLLATGFPLLRTSVLTPQIPRQDLRPRYARSGHSTCSNPRSLLATSLCSDWSDI